MRRCCSIAIFLGILGTAWGAYDSALAPYPKLKAQLDPSVEGLLQSLEANAANEAGFSGTVTWTTSPGVKLDVERDHYGPLSLKSCPNWHLPKNGGFWEAGSFSVVIKPRAFRIEKPADDLSPADWWQKDGEHTYARAWSIDWPTVWRFHHDTFEADILGYGEGLGLLLWAFDPGEYLRRAETLQAGEDRRINGGVYKTLIATPAWIKKALFLENRKHYPFNESTLISWATHRPVVTYFIDPEKNAVIGAEFVYHAVVRTSPNDWQAASAPSGIVVTCLATELGQTRNGTWFPVKVVGEVYKKDELLRRTVMAIEPAEKPLSINPPPLPAGKRMIDPWPPYRPEVFRDFMASGDVSHATRLGLAKALAYEGDIDNAEVAMGEAIGFMEQDKTLLPETFGGIDWELGFALYELFWRYNDAELGTFWDTVPRTDTWLDVVNRAVDLYSRFRSKEAERIENLHAGQRLLYAQIRQGSYLGRCRVAHVADLRRRAAQATTEKERICLEKLAAKVEARLGQ